MPEASYDQIGQTYVATRRPDPRIATAIRVALRDADTIVNVGAGAGAYEPVKKRTVAVEPSWRMIQQRYLPEIIEFDRGRSPSIAEIAGEIGDCSVHHVPIPHDCVDGFLAAFWRRPEAYLDPAVRAGISSFALLDQDAVTRGIARLERDITSGAWDERFGGLRSLDVLDVGYRLLATQ